MSLSNAEPFINTQDLTLKASIQHLKNSGYLQIPTNTYPLMWIDIYSEFKKIERDKLSTSQKQSYDYIFTRYKRANKKQLIAKANSASEHKRFVSFGDTYRNRNNVGISASQVLKRLAYKVSIAYTPSPEDDRQNFLFDDSYVALRLGNWNLSLGTQDRWWGPGWDSNIGLTNNARPIPTIALKRNRSLPVTIPFTNYQIPWNVSTFMGQMESNRTVPNTLLWGFRLNFMPIDNLELSLVRLAQWGGDGRPANLSVFTDLFLGKDNCGVDGLNCADDPQSEPGNQQAGYDLRYSFNLFNMPMSFYGQYFGEDGDASGGLNFITKPAIQLGFDGNFRLYNNNLTWFIEYSDTFKTCGTARTTANCFFEHHIYQNGMRYRGRNIGHLYDNDAQSLVAGIIGESSSATKWDLRLRYIELNLDNTDRFPNDPRGNSITEIAEDLLMFSGNISKTYNNIDYKLGLELSQSKFINQDNDIEFDISLSISYLL